MAEGRGSRRTGGGRGRRREAGEERRGGSGPKTTVISEGQRARARAHEGGARNLRATWIRAAFNPADELAIMKLGWVRW